MDTLVQPRVEHARRVERIVTGHATSDARASGSRVC